jgi:hypothetical protein
VNNLSTFQPSNLLEKGQAQAKRDQQAAPKPNPMDVLTLVF